MPYHNVPANELAATIEQLERDGHTVVQIEHTAPKRVHIVTRAPASSFMTRNVPTVTGGPS